MCGRFVSDIPSDQLKSFYGLPSLPEIITRYNIAPSQQIPIVRQHNGGDRELAFLQWGLIPPWAKDPAVGNKMINARSETAHEKPSFRQALRSRRCIIPASGFYEWERRGNEKIPHYIHFKDGEIMSLAGLWEIWKSPDKVSLETCTILTTTANSLIKNIHDRMPVILHNDELDIWLDRSIDDISRLTQFFHSYPSDRIEEYIVSKDVNNPSNDNPSCIIPV